MIIHNVSLLYKVYYNLTIRVVDNVGIIGLEKEIEYLEALKFNFLRTWKNPELDNEIEKLKEKVSNIYNQTWKIFLKNRKNFF